jgi:hypothetical protein
MNKKLKLDDLKVESFVTSLRGVQGGATALCEQGTFPVRECYNTPYTNTSNPHTQWPCQSVHQACDSGGFCTQTVPCSVGETACTGNCC